ncbi:hypothetical protein RKE29_09210 [Streptomyces sp. B1866]|uniref:hypothetical protein n=1 Tax=Streptomyces sp. B1866 TaxID=3075431 RepID=UPI0028923869|nr:hypothetical protein [Streptomyces sp. B1866]MDT3396818.1 hypothetical protein [Streptomyces sp. B1866]
MIVLAGCSMNGSDDPGYTPKRREIKDIREEAERLSSQILDIIDLRGKVSEPGPGVALCGEKDPEQFFTIHHPWSLTRVPVVDLGQAMVRLRDGLPKMGWEVTKYGPDGSPSRSLELIANSTRVQFSVDIIFYDESKQSKPTGSSMIHVDLSSACFQVPEGKTVDEY